MTKLSGKLNPEKRIELREAANTQINTGYSLYSTLKRVVSMPAKVTIKQSFIKIFIEPNFFHYSFHTSITAV